MIEGQAGAKSADSGKEWQKTQYSNLIRYVPSGTYFARLRVNGNLIRKSLKTDVLSVAKLRLGDLAKQERESAETIQSASKGKMTFGDCVAIFKTQTEASNLLKPTSKFYRREVVESIARSWPGIGSLDVRRISANDCNSWPMETDVGRMFGNSFVQSILVRLPESTQVTNSAVGMERFP